MATMIIFARNMELQAGKIYDSPASAQCHNLQGHVLYYKLVWQTWLREAPK